MRSVVLLAISGLMVLDAVRSSSLSTPPSSLTAHGDRHSVSTDLLRRRRRLSQTSFAPSAAPSNKPSAAPPEKPTPAQTLHPSSLPTPHPTLGPTLVPTPLPIPKPTLLTTLSPTSLPTLPPSPVPSSTPTSLPSASPSPLPSSAPTSRPSLGPTPSPSFLPSMTHRPTASPEPTYSPSLPPSPRPSPGPTQRPSAFPSPLPTAVPSQPGALKAKLSFKLYLNFETTASSPTEDQATSLKKQLANATGVPASSMFNFKVVLDSEPPPTPYPTPYPSPVPTPVPTGLCGCPKAYRTYVNDTLGSTDDITDLLCNYLSPLTTTETFEVCCNYCCVIVGDRCNTNYADAAYDIYGFVRRSRMLRGQSLEELSDAHSADLASESTSSMPHGRRLESVFWDVQYTILVLPEDTSLGVTTPTELATSVTTALATTSLKLAGVASVAPEPATLATAVEGITRAPTPQPSSPAPTRQPTHVPTQSVQPTVAPSPAPFISPTPPPTWRPSHAPTFYFVEHSSEFVFGTPATSFRLKAMALAIPILLVLLALLGSASCRLKPRFCSICFPEESERPLVMFSNFVTGSEDAAKAEDEKFDIAHKSAPVYTWAKSFHAKFLVQATPTGNALRNTISTMEAKQMLGLSKYAPVTVGGPQMMRSDDDGWNEEEEGKFEASSFSRFVTAVDEGEVVSPDTYGNTLKLGEAGPSEEERLVQMEQVAVAMARKQQELVDALTVAEEKQTGLQLELATLKSSKGKTAQLASIRDATETLGRGEHAAFLEDWVKNGALVDARVQDAPLPPPGYQTPSEAAAVAKLEAAAKAKKKAKKAKKKKADAARRAQDEAEEAGGDNEAESGAFSTLVPLDGASWALPSSLGFGALQEESTQMSPLQQQEQPRNSGGDVYL